MANTHQFFSSQDQDDITVVNMTRVSQFPPSTSSQPTRLSQQQRVSQSSDNDTAMIIDGEEEEEDRTRRTDHREASSPSSTKSKVNCEEETKRKIEESGINMDALFCPICMDPWTIQGDHQVSCLPCGHLYGMSCISRWIQHHGRSSAKCPQCNASCMLKDIRKLYASPVVVVDEGLRKKVESLEAEIGSLKSERANLIDVQDNLLNVQDNLLKALRQLKEKPASLENVLLGEMGRKPHRFFTAKEVQEGQSGLIMAPKRGQASSSSGSGPHSETFGFSIKRWKPSLRHNEPIPILFRPEQHVSTSVRQREYPRVPTGRGNYAGTLAWWRRLLPATRTLVRNAGFGAFINLLDGEGTPTLLACLAERWWDTTHTFHLAGRELTMTPYEFYRISGLRIGGRIVEIHSVDSAGDLSARVLHRRYADTISYPSLAEDFKDAPQDTAEERTIMARAFILYLFGAQIFPNAGQSISVFFLTLLEDLSQVSEYAWGSAALAFLYANMDALSRGASSSTAGYWRAWTVWARRLLFHNASIDLSASHVVRSHIDNLTWGEVYTRPWYRAESLAPAAWDEEALDKSFFSHLMECPGARAFYLAERVTPQLQSGLDMPVPIDPPPHMLFPFRIPDGLLESWREGTIYRNRFSRDDEYRFFAARHLMPPLGAPAPAHEAPPSPHAVDPIFPPWTMTMYQSPHDITEVSIPRSTVVYGYPFAPGTRQVTNLEAEGLVQMIGNLKSEFTRMSLRACNAEATQERGGQQGGDGEDGDTSSLAPSRSFIGASSTATPSRRPRRPKRGQQ